MGDDPTRPITVDRCSSSSRALELLYRRYGAWLKRALKKRFGPDAAEDLAQEAYLRLARSGQAEAVEHPKSLLLKIAVNAGLDQVRRDRRQVGGGSVVPFPDLPRDATDADQAEALLLKQIILSLPPILRDVFVLSRFAGLSYEQIAGRLGISVKTVEWRMSRALVICAERIAAEPSDRI
jgi:RNA polymerase sigma-70 factor (ECF subfamily)